MYDPCATKTATEQSTGILSHIMDPNKWYNCNPCRADFGIVGGNQVSLYTGNLVDLESDLRGQTRMASQCPSSQYLPGTVVQGKDTYACGPNSGAGGLPCGNGAIRREKLAHLPTCQLIRYGPRPETVGYELTFPKCPTMGHTPKPSRKSKARKNPYVPLEWQGQQGARY